MNCKQQELVNSMEVNKKLQKENKLGILVFFEHALLN